MGIIMPALSENPLRTKADLQRAFQQLVKPLLSYYSNGNARLKLPGNISAGYSSVIAEMEGFSRVIWGLTPFLAGGGIDDELLHICLNGIENGTDPMHEEYWGKVNDYDQRLVEMASFGFALALIPERIWEPLSPRARENFYNWLNQINSHPVYECNWLFFHVLVNLGFRKIGLPYEQSQMEVNLERIDSFYLSDGWYSDGNGGHSDYYVPFAIQYYGLLYAKLMIQEDPERSARFHSRADEFAHQFIHWFSSDGRSLPYGRSLTYRFSQGAFWGALAFADVESFSPGVLKGLFLRHLRWWFQQPIFTSDGILTIGYTYPNLIMAENYNAAGSVYWAMKVFLPLALPDDHPFWNAEELPLPELPRVIDQQAPHFIICREQHNGHVAAFNAGHLQSNEHTHTSAKYEKFVYSSTFGFSVPRAEWGLSQGAFDCMLALSEGDNLYRVRRKNEQTSIKEDLITAIWKPWSDVVITSTIVVGLPWHLRIHRIETNRHINVAEGGFSLPLIGSLKQTEHELGIVGTNDFGRSGIAGIMGYDEAVLQYIQSNTNVMHPRTTIPTLKRNLTPGKHVLVAAIYGEPESTNQKGNRSIELLSPPFEVELVKDRLRIIGPTGKQYMI
ncbi:hypothetical protein D3C74_183980 [compost metagenome]